MKIKNALKTSFALMVSGLIVFSACKKKDDDPAPQNPITLPPPPGQKTIVELAIERDFDSLAVALTQTGLISEFDQVSDGQKTVFAPTNAAFRTLLGLLEVSSISEVNNNVLTQILLYHVIGSEVKSNNLSEGQLVKTLSGFTFRVALSGGARLFPTANSFTNITATDIDASNGVIHVIDAVIYPDAPGVLNGVPAPTQTIAAAADDAGLDSLVVALSRLNLVHTFANAEARFTVFAPTNQAFVNLCGALGVNSIAEINLETLTAAITYHAVDGIISSPQLADGQTIRPLNTTANPPIRVVVGGGTVQLRDVDNGLSTVTTADVWCTNGVVHVIDRVLLPIDL